MDPLIEMLLRWLATAGGGALILYGSFHWLGKKWLGGWVDQRFAKQLEQFKHEQQKGLEQFKHAQQLELERVRHSLDRNSRVAEKEHEVLSQAWELLQKANGAVFQVAKTFKQFPNIDAMSDAEFEDFVKRCTFSDFCKNELRQSNDRQKFYQEHSFWVELNEAQKAREVFNNHLALNGIFITEDIRDRLREINMALARILMDEQQLHNDDRRSLGQYAMELQKEVQNTLSDVGRMVGELTPELQNRLRG